jgi:hypothetical protein
MVQSFLGSLNSRSLRLGETTLKLKSSIAKAFRESKTRTRCSRLLLIPLSIDSSGLTLPFGDGPYMFTNQLSSNFRTETINVTDIVLNKGSAFESFFIQGSQRWQSIKLTQGSRLSLRSVGFRPTSATTAKQDSSGVSSSSSATILKQTNLNRARDRMLLLPTHTTPLNAATACIIVSGH